MSGLMEYAVDQAGEHTSDYAYTQTYRKIGETILEAIYKTQMSDLLQVIIVVKTGFVVRKNHSKPNYTVTIYKAAKKDSMSELVAEAMAAASNEVHAEESKHHD